MSTRELESTVINGSTYEVGKLGATRAWKLGLKVGRVLGPSMAVFMDKFSEGGVDAVLETDLADDSMSRAVSLLVDRLDEKTMDEVMTAMAEITLVDGKKLSGVFDVHFMGDLGSMSRWLVFAIKVNFGNFISAWGGGSNPGV